MLRIKTFLEALGIPSEDQQDPSSWIGLTAWAILNFEETAQYGKKNTVKTFVKGS